MCVPVPVTVPLTVWVLVDAVLALCVCVCGGGGGVRAYEWVFAGGIYVVYPGYVSLCLVVLVHLLVRW